VGNPRGRPNNRAFTNKEFFLLTKELLIPTETPVSALARWTGGGFLD